MNSPTAMSTTTPEPEVSDEELHDYNELRSILEGRGSRQLMPRTLAQDVLNVEAAA